MSDTAIMNEMIKLEFKISQVLGLNPEADITNYRHAIGFYARLLRE